MYFPSLRAFERAIPFSSVTTVSTTLLVALSIMSNLTSFNLTSASASSNLVILIFPAISAVTVAPTDLTVFTLNVASVLVPVLPPYFSQISCGWLSIKYCAELLIVEVSAGEDVSYVKKKLFVPILVGMSNSNPRFPLTKVNKAFLSESALYASGSVVISYLSPICLRADEFVFVVSNSASYI